MRRGFSWLGVLICLGPVTACSNGKGDDPSLESAALTSIPPASIKLVGTLASGEVTAPIAYQAPPRYHGVTLAVTSGSAVDVWVRSSDGDAMAWLLDGDHRVIAENDDADGTTFDSHLHAELTGTGPYVVAFREYGQQPSQFVLSLEATCVPMTCDDAGAECGALDDGCGGTLACGGCASGETCGAAGVPNVCPDVACTDATAFKATYGQPFRSDDILLITANGQTHRGLHRIDVPAMRNWTQGPVRVIGTSSALSEVRLVATGTDRVLASRSGAYIYGLGHTAWKQALWGGDRLPVTMMRQLNGPDLSYPQLAAILRVLVHKASLQVPAADQYDFLTAGNSLVEEVESGSRTVPIGHAHAIAFTGSARQVNGKTFSFQYSTSLGLPLELGFQRNGVWGSLWTAYDLAPACFGCTEQVYGDRTLRYCASPLPRDEAQAVCAGGGGTLVIADDIYTHAAARALDPGADGAWIGLTDRAIEGEFVWDTGAPLVGGQWHRNEPSDADGSADCVRIVDFDGRSPRWADQACATPSPYVCER